MPATESWDWRLVIFTRWRASRFALSVGTKPTTLYLKEETVKKPLLTTLLTKQERMKWRAMRMCKNNCNHTSLDLDDLLEAETQREKKWFRISVVLCLISTGALILLALGTY